MSESSKVFLFSEGLYEADPFHLQNMDQFRKLVRRSGLYGRGTDLGTALDKLMARKPSVLTDATTLLILSDTKTTGQRRALKSLEEAKRQAGKVIILNPIPEGKWRLIRTVQDFANVTTMISCSTLRDLAAACRRLT